ncbi:uncharacterized protein RSE6_06607 [Rhynchosporium secalis]|uniref:DUF2423 domain-containing protein n=1 Tax=Rhynchosporium secalis TaxID=38038 RepID=A0A1E1MAY6_RHYSE|nr:uncharacterized protein RSE6_06607 [Rhynchosporium secalis]
MAKGSRASTKKANNAKLKSRVFGPVETDRTARLSAKLMALAAQPKTKKDVEMEEEEVEEEDVAPEEKAVPVAVESKQTEAMEVDGNSAKVNSKSGKGEIKRRVSKRRSAIVFSKYNERSKVSKKQKKGKK